MRFSIFTFILVFILIGVCYAEERDSFGIKSMETNQQVCYALGNIGFDAVKNVDAGVPKSEAMQQALLGGGFSQLIARVVNDAYDWSASPHEYAIKVYSNCMTIFNDTVEM